MFEASSKTIDELKNLQLKFLQYAVKVTGIQKGKAVKSKAMYDVSFPN